MGRLPTNTSARVVVVDPVQPKRVYAANRAGAYRSDDAGQTWSAADQGLGEKDITSLALDPRQPSRLFALTHGGAAYLSEDGADSWRLTGGREGT